MNLVMSKLNKSMEVFRMQYHLSPEIKPEFCTSGTFMRLPSSRENIKLAIIWMPYL